MIAGHAESCLNCANEKSIPTHDCGSSLALIFFCPLPLPPPAASAILRTPSTWRRNPHMTACHTLRGESAVLPGSSQVYREETVEGDFHNKSDCFCLLFYCFWSTFRSFTSLCIPYRDVTLVLPKAFS